MWKRIRKDFTSIIVAFNIMLVLCFIIIASYLNVKGYEIQDSIIYGFFGFFGVENGCCAFVYKHKGKVLEIADKALEATQQTIKNEQQIQTEEGAETEDNLK